ncbi:hypothetical protein HPB48_008417 [Haemaphysalis longicornis]|uniref:Uncharacterized protein n=1 Tax=Haemaphysalis longicornis TaxID=44386 RepID=A0A9J6GZQ5_HAELO|nr:hypothetical protein HPB48_008417 [Haemaphysalis longicornis]
MAWAPGKGVKGKELKDYWEVDLGVSYIPLDKLPANVDLSALEEGGVLDQDSLPDSLKVPQHVVKCESTLRERPHHGIAWYGRPCGEDPPAHSSQGGSPHTPARRKFAAS